MSIKVLVVDDSAFMRQTIKSILEADPELKVVGVAVDGEDALKKIGFYKPQVITLDLRMPRMDGLAFLTALKKTSPLPVVLVSSWAQEGTEETLKALELGAVDFVTKPSSEPSEEIWQIAGELREKVKAVANVLVDKIQDLPEKEIATVSPTLERSHLQILAMGASTGGPRAFQYILTHLSADFPLGVLLAQHMPSEFMGIFASRLNGMSQLRVKLAEEGDVIYPGMVLVAPGGLQTRLVKKKDAHGNDSIRVHLTREKNLYQPSIDEMFFSVAETYGNQAIGVLLTGMGADGARGLQRLREKGGLTIAESPETCVIYGMPKAAHDLGAVDYLLPLTEIPDRICTLISEQNFSGKAK
jgi:two-component system chemotaxis response regulator CheB